MEQRDFTEYLSRETVLSLTEEAFSEAGQTARVRNFPRWAAFAAAIALVVTAINFDTVYAAVQSLLYFLPGRGPVAEQTIPDYWLPTEEYAAHTDEADYLVAYLYRWGDTLFLRVKKTIEGRDLFPEIDRYAEARAMAGEDPSAAPEESIVPGFSRIAIRDQEGNLLELEDGHSGAFAVYSPDRAELEEEWEFPNFTLERFTLVLDDAVEFSVELRKIAAEDYAVAGGSTVRDKGYAITLLPLNQNCSRFALLTAPEDPGNAPEESYWTPLSFEIDAIGESGKAYEAESVSSRPACQEFYLPDLPEEKITRITVTGILESTRYGEKTAAITDDGVLEGIRYGKKGAPTLQLPALELGEETELDTEVELWNDTLRLEAAGLTEEGKYWFRLRCGEEGRRLNQIDLEWPKKKEADPAANRRVGQRTAVGEAGDYTVSVLGRSDLAGKKTTLSVSFVSVVQEGEWEFQVPADQP